VNSGAKLHLDFLTNVTIFKELQLAGLGPFNNPFFARTCKDFSPMYPNLIYHSLVESSSVPTKVANRAVIVLPFN